MLKIFEFIFENLKNPELIYQDLTIPSKSIKVYLDFISLIKSKLKIHKTNISSKRNSC